MSQDSLINDEEDNNNKNSEQSPSTAVHSRMNSKSTNGNRSINLDEHIKLVKQKKEETDVLRLQRIQEQLRKKEQKWQQQQLEKVKKWFQLRNRDTGHRSQVEERRRKREEETKFKIDELLRREKEREQNFQQRTNSQRAHSSHKPDSVMSMSTDVLSTRRAVSTSRIRSNQQNIANRLGSNDSPISITSQDNVDNSASANSSHQHNSMGEHRYHHRSRHSHDATLTNDDSSLSGTPRSSARSRTRPMPAYTFWLNTGDNNNNMTASFMRLTHAAMCRARVSRSVGRCPRACRAQDELAAAAAVTTNGEPQRRTQSINRQHLDETMRRLSKPKTFPMSQSVHTSSPNGIPSSQSSHQIRVSTPPITANTHLTPTPTTTTSSHIRRHIQSRPVTAQSHHISSTASSTDSRASPTDESTSEHHSISSSIGQSSNRPALHPKVPLPSSSKPPKSARPKPPVQRSLMTTSYSSSSLSSTATTTTNKQNVRRIGGIPPSKQKPVAEPPPAIETSNNQILIKDTEVEEETLPVNEDTQEAEEEGEEQTPPEVPVQTLPKVQVPAPSVEPINIDTVTEILNPTASLSKREQQLVDEQDYQRKLNQKIREAQQRLEVERQREEERQHQLELEENEREQEQIRLVEEQRQVEQERLQRAIEECERENELKRQEEQRLQQQREDLEKKQAEETERLNRERQERAKKEEEERNERKKRLDLIMRRTRQVSPNPKPESNNNIITNVETNGHTQQPIPHSISENHFPMLSSTDNLLINNDSTTTDIPKFKSPLIQSLVNKARNTRSTDNLTQSNMTTSQIMVDEETKATDLSDDDENDHQDSEIDNSTINGHTDSPLSSSTNINSYLDRPIEAATAFQ